MHNAGYEAQQQSGPRRYREQDISSPRYSLGALIHVVDVLIFCRENQRMIRTIE